MTAGKKVVPKLLRLTWMGYPLHRHETEKWGYLKPNEDVSAVDEQFDRDDAENVTFSRRSLKNFLEETNVIQKSFKKRENWKHIQFLTRINLLRHLASKKI